MTNRPPAPTDPSDQWRSDRTTFQRVYDLLVGTTDPVAARQFAEWAHCSETGARQALEQLVEMGIAERTGTRPAQYQRNPSYFQWKRVETLAREQSVSELRSRLAALIETDKELQTTYGVPTPDAVVVSADSVEEYDALSDQWNDLTEWRTIRRDITLLKRAVQRATAATDGRMQSET